MATELDLDDAFRTVGRAIAAAKDAGRDDLVPPPPDYSGPVALPAMNAEDSVRFVNDIWQRMKARSATDLAQLLKLYKHRGDTEH